MSQGQIIFYDYEHCRDFLEMRACELRESAHGLDTLATFRELMYGFAYEALEQESIVLGQFDTGVVYVFTPDELVTERYPQGNEIARMKALELLDATLPPLVIDLLEGQSDRDTLSSKGRIEKWMRPEFMTDVILARKVDIQIFFDGGAFFSEVMTPQLKTHGFEVRNTYEESAEAGELKVRHSARPGKVYRLPWVSWVREMMGGGYNIIYLMACFATYLQKLDEAVA